MGNGQWATEVKPRNTRKGSDPWKWTRWTVCTDGRSADDGIGDVRSFGVVDLRGVTREVNRNRRLEESRLLFGVAPSDHEMFFVIIRVI